MSVVRITYSYPAPSPAVPAQRISARPNDGSGLWADSSNTGYLNATGFTPTDTSIPCTHGYAGIYDFASGMSATTGLFVDSGDSGSITYNLMHFRGKTYVGKEATCPSATFNGCVFDGTWPNDNLIQVYVPTLFRLNYCTLKPAAYSTPPGNSGTVSTSPTAPGTPCSSSWQYVENALGGGASGQTGESYTQFEHCDIWGNAGLEVTRYGTSGNPTVFDWCYIHDQADNDWSGGCTYHHDGIGPDSTGPETWINVTNCTFATLGVTNALAFQGSAGCNNCTITGNYFTGWGLAISLSTAGPTEDYSVEFTDNVFSAEVPYIYGPMYSNWSWDSGGTPPTANTQMLWRGNQWQVRSGDPTTEWVAGPNGSGGSIPWSSTWQGQYWWPSDNNPHASDYTG